MSITEFPDVDYRTTEVELGRLVEAAGLRMTATPTTRPDAADWSKDALHFSVALTVPGKPALPAFVTSYSAGFGLAVDHFARNTKPGAAFNSIGAEVKRAIREDGQGWLRRVHYDGLKQRIRDRYRPNLADVVSCLCRDADGELDSFDDWCSDLGMDSDSRKALAMFEQCQKTRAWLRRALGDKFELALHYARSM